MKLNFLKYFLFGLLLTSFFACERENMDTTEITEEPDEPEIVEEPNALLNRMNGDEDSESLELGCFELVLPIELETLDGEVISINDEQDFFEVIESNDSLIIDFVAFPLLGQL